MFIADLQNILSEFTDGKKGNAIKHARIYVSLNPSHLAEIKKIDEMDAFFQEREKLKRMALGKTTLFQLAELDKLLDAFKEHGLTDLEFKKFLQDEYTRIVEEGNVERNKLDNIVLGDTAEFQLEQLNLLEKNYLEHFEHTLESEKYFADERKRIANSIDREFLELDAVIGGQISIEITPKG